MLRRSFFKGHISVYYVETASKYVELLNKNMSVDAVETLVDLHEKISDLREGRPLQEKIDELIKSLGEPAAGKLFQLLDIESTNPEYRVEHYKRYLDALCKTNDARLGEFLKIIFQKR